MKLLVQPEDGVFPVLKAIGKARRSIDMHIFRLDHKEIEKALRAAVARGVVVRTLIAHTNARGEKGLRKLEQRLLDAGATVSRTDDDLVRYHGKMMIVDGVWLYVFAFNLTRLDLDRSRSLGIATRKRALVQEALRLFEADFDRKPYTGGAKDFLVSPVNARERLGAFLKGAKKQLLIYDAALTDNKMIARPAGPPEGGRRRPHHRQGREGQARPRGRSPRRQAPAPALHRARRPRRVPGQPEPAPAGARRAPRDRGDRPRREGGERHRQDLRVGLGEDRRAGASRLARTPREARRARRSSCSASSPAAARAQDPAAQASTPNAAGRRALRSRRRAPLLPGLRLPQAVDAAHHRRRCSTSRPSRAASSPRRRAAAGRRRA